MEWLKWLLAKVATSLMTFCFNTCKCTQTLVISFQNKTPKSALGNCFKKTCLVKNQQCAYKRLKLFVFSVRLRNKIGPNGTLTSRRPFNGYKEVENSLYQTLEATVTKMIKQRGDWVYLRDGFSNKEVTASCLFAVAKK